MNYRSISSHKGRIILLFLMLNCSISPLFGESEVGERGAGGIKDWISKLWPGGGSNPNPNPGPSTGASPTSISDFIQKWKDSAPEHLGSFAIADWLNSLNIGSFFDDTTQYLERTPQCFTIFNPSIDWNLWAEPYIFHSHYQTPLNRKDKIDFGLTTAGLLAGSRYAISDEISLGGGLGYYHSKLDESTINGVYLGPSIQYFYPGGSVGFMLYGIGNFYDVSKKTAGSGHTYHSWDIAMRLEADYELELPSNFFIHDFYIRPFLRIDYLNVFEQKQQDKVKKADLTKRMDIENRHSSFFYSKLGVVLSKMMICRKTVFLMSNFDIGWIKMLPLSTESLKWEIKGFKSESESIKLGSKDQLALGLELVGMRNNGILASVSYEAAIGSSSPMQTGRIRIEWNW